MFDRIDEWLMSSLTEYEGVPFVDVMRGDVSLPASLSPTTTKMTKKPKNIR